MSVREFASRIGKTAGYVSQIEARDEIPAPELICHIAQEFKQDAEELLEIAKRSQLQRVEKEIERKYESALALHRKEKQSEK